MGISISRQDGTTLVTLDWPEKRNALDVDQMSDLSAALEEAAGGDTSVIVLTGNGAFCAGANLRKVTSRSALSETERRSLVENVAHRLIRAVVDAPIPVIAAVDGPAVGLGFDLALACNCRLIGPRGWMMQGWGRIGVIPGAGGELLLRLLNPSILWRLLEQQPRITGPEAERWGLGEAVSSGSALDAALGRATALADLPRETVLAYTSLHRSTLRRELPAHLAECAEVQPRLLASPAVAERVARLLGPQPE